MKISKNVCQAVALLLALLLLLAACDTSDPIDPVPGPDEVPGKEEPRQVDEWIDYMLEKELDWISCTVGGESFASLSATRLVAEETNDASRMITVTETSGSLRFVTKLTVFKKSDALEIVTTIENTGSEKSAQIAELCAADISIPILGGKGITLTTARGCLATGVDDDYDFGELTYPMGVGGSYTFTPQGGRSCNEGWPYFDLVGTEGGAVVAIGWTGQWEATFTTAPGGVNVRAGQQYFDAYLKAGESVTTPSVTVMFYRGSSEDGRNDFRQLYLNSYVPENVKDPNFIYPISTNIGYDTQSALDRIQTCKNLGLTDICLWQDAGWYGTDQVDWNSQVGNWYPNSDLGESGMKQISDAIHDAGYRYILWFEPERAQPGSQAAKQRNLFYSYQGPSGLLLRLDTEEGYAWMWNLLSTAVEKYGMDIYRQDFNINPLDYWLENDASDRVGITENKYINNLYRMMDALLAKFPHLVIDNCASGGRRLDIAMMKRCISLFRTDYSCLETCDPQGIQHHQQNILSWIPLTSAGLWGDLNDSYIAYSAMSVGLIVDPTNRYAIRLTRELQPYYRGNYYNLFEAAYDEISNQAWMLFDPDTDSGFVVALKRPSGIDGYTHLKLRGLDAETRYTITIHEDDETLCEATGEELMTKGFDVYLRARSGKLLMIAPATAEGGETA